jgi:hypothetical protein
VKLHEARPMIFPIQQEHGCGALKKPTSPEVQFTSLDEDQVLDQKSVLVTTDSPD